MAFGKLYYGCPECDARSFVPRGDRDGIYLNCPNCGERQIKIGRLGGLRTVRPETEEYDFLVQWSDPGSPLRGPNRHPVAFAVIFLPVVASVIVASVIHRFSFFYLLIPGFWCYGVGGFILNGIFSGGFSDNQGTALRRISPFRFWGKIGIWSLFYLFAAAFPIGFAIQESRKEKSKTEQRVISDQPLPSSEKPISPAGE